MIPKEEVSYVSDRAATLNPERPKARAGSEARGFQQRPANARGRVSASVSLFDKLLELASRAAPQSRDLRTTEFLEKLSLYRSSLVAAPTSTEAERVASDAVSLCEDFFRRSEDYHAERDRKRCRRRWHRR